METHPPIKNSVDEAYKRDWPNYNAAQTQEKLLAIRLLSDAIDFIQVPYQYGGNGRPPQDTADMLKACIIKVFNNFSSRRIIPDLRLAWGMGCINHIPHFNIINKYMRSAQITPYLHLVYKTLATPMAGVESVFAADATGFSVSKKHWIDYRLEKREVKDFKKLHIICGVRTNTITHAVVTEGNRHDSPYFGDLVNGTPKVFRMKEICADAGYLSRKNCDMVMQLNAFPFIMPKKGVQAKARGSQAWKEMITFWMENQEVFKQHYHQRSNSESSFSMLKRKFSPYLRSKSEQGQFNEMLCKVVCHNLSVLVTAMFELDIDAAFKKLDPEKQS